MGYFDKTKGVISLSQKFKYIQNHFTYWTMNSWNGLKSIANNVKLYNLGLTKEQEDKLWDLESADPYGYWDFINDCLREECNCSGLNVGFNGRSSGYLVLYDTDANGCAVRGDYWDYDSYKDWVKDYAEGYDYRAAQSDVRYMIEKDFDLVRSFDQLCDTMRENLIYMAENADIEEDTYTVTKTVQRLVFA